MAYLRTKALGVKGGRGKDHLRNIYYIVDKSQNSSGEWLRLGDISATEAQQTLLEFEKDKLAWRLRLARKNRYTVQNIVDGYQADQDWTFKVKPETLNCEKRLLKLFAAEFGTLPIDQLKSVKIHRWFKERDYKPATQHQYVCVIKKIYKRAIALHYLKDTPIADLRREKLPKRKPRYVSPEVMKKILDAMTPKTRRPYEIMRYTGMRPSEVLRLKPKHINLEMKVIELAPEETKTKDTAVIEIPDKLMPLLKAAIKGKKKDEYLFVSPKGGHQKSLRNALRRASDATGVEMTAYQFRHTFATMLLNMTGDLALVQDSLRHASPQTTRVYAWTLRDRKRAAINKL